MMKQNNEVHDTVIVDMLSKLHNRNIWTKPMACIPGGFVSSVLLLHLSVAFDKQQHAKRKRLSDIVENIIYIMRRIRYTQFVPDQWFQICRRVYQIKWIPIYPTQMWENEIGSNSSWEQESLMNRSSFCRLLSNLGETNGG